MHSLGFRGMRKLITRSVIPTIAVKLGYGRDSIGVNSYKATSGKEKLEATLEPTA